MGAEFVQLSLVPMFTGALAAVACALPGNFLLLRRQTLVGDAISHVVLPGIVAGFLLAGRIATMPMMLGAAAAALASVGLIELVRRTGRIEPGAAMGVVFTTMFALGVLMLEVAGASGVHLDVEHALYGNLESLIWLDAAGWVSLTDPVALAALPPELPRIAAVAAVAGLALRLIWRPLALSTFDEGYARALGLPVAAVSTGLAALAALAAVAAFDAVGSIIVIAMFVAPPATARLLTDDLATQVWLSVAIAASAAIAGFWLAADLPLVLGSPHAVSAAGMIATVSGAGLAAAALAGHHRRRLR